MTDRDCATVTVELEFELPITPGDLERIYCELREQVEQ